jgi:ubiquinone/menaquinone biosynthesis C-methylase UbiE
VLYHKNVKDDIGAMKELNRVLKSKGSVFITDSAMMCLYGGHDLANHGIRRYSKKELKHKLRKAGFMAKKLTYYNTLLFPLIYLNRKLGNLIEKNKAKSDIQEINFILNWLLEKLFKFELSFLRFIDYPFGVSVFCVAKKVNF